MKALQWEKLTAEFYAFIGDQNLVSKAQLVRKWQFRTIETVEDYRSEEFLYTEKPLLCCR